MHQQSTYPLTTSSYFQDLFALYQAELDDLQSDSEGNNLLAKRLEEKRSELPFLMQMMESNPELLAVVLHQAFRFTSPAAMDQMVSREADEIPDWDTISRAIDIAPNAVDVVQTILQAPGGKGFMTLAAALEYLQHRRPMMAAPTEDDEEDGATDQDDVRSHRHDDNQTEDYDDNHDNEAAARSRDAAANDWMEQQGFDRKDTP